MAARENKVYLDNFVKGDNVNSAKLEISRGIEAGNRVA
jgi:hypothetical protein